MSPFFLLYGERPRVAGDQDPPQDASTPRIQDWTHKVAMLTSARSRANELLLNRAIRAQRIRDTLVTRYPFKEGQWVLVRNESRQKFEGRWFGPYKVLKSHPLGTYALQEPGGRVLRNLINGARLLEAYVDRPEQLWNSSAAGRQLKRAGLSLQHPDEVRTVLDSLEPLPTAYAELSTIPYKQWQEMQRTGVRSLLEGEGVRATMEERVVNQALSKSRAKGQKKQETNLQGEIHHHLAPQEPGQYSSEKEPLATREDAASPTAEVEAEIESQEETAGEGSNRAAAAAREVRDASQASREVVRNEPQNKETTDGDITQDAPYSFRKKRRYWGPNGKAIRS